MTLYRKYQGVYIATDAVAAVVVWIGFLLFRWLVYEGRVLSTDTVLIPAFGFWKPLVLYPLACLVIHYLSGFYLRPLHRPRFQVLTCTLVSSVIIALLAFFVIIIDDQVDSYHRYIGALVVLFGLQFTVSLIPRLCLSAWIRKHITKREEIRIEMPEGATERELYERIRNAYPTGKDILVKPTVHDILFGAARIREIEDEAWICISENKMQDWEICHKRAFDIAVAIVTLTVLSPLYLLLAIAIKADSQGPVIYRQQRTGLHGLPFQILKFRTMQAGAEQGVPQLADEDDPRTTKVGKWLRKYRLDELPQMVNVLKGDMSLVGPRPERPYFIEKIEQQAPYYCLLYKIRPGLTSWGPIKVGYTDTMEKMLQRLHYDLTYMENMSLLLDLKILFFTIKVIVDGKGK